jgi:hypothetical protein
LLVIKKKILEVKKAAMLEEYKKKNSKERERNNK